MELHSSSFWFLQVAKAINRNTLAFSFPLNGQTHILNTLLLTGTHTHTHTEVTVVENIHTKKKPFSVELRMSVDLGKLAGRVRRSSNTFSF